MSVEGTRGRQHSFVVNTIECHVQSSCTVPIRCTAKMYSKNCYCTVEFLDSAATCNRSLASKRTFSVVLKTHAPQYIHTTFRKHRPKNENTTLCTTFPKHRLKHIHHTIYARRFESIVLKTRTPHFIARRFESIVLKHVHHTL
jgi:hypothetical protein